MRLNFDFIYRLLLKVSVTGLKFIVLDVAVFCLLFWGVPYLIGNDFLAFLVPQFRLPLFFIPLPSF